MIKNTPYELGQIIVNTDDYRDYILPFLSLRHRSYITTGW